MNLWVGLIIRILHKPQEIFFITKNGKKANISWWKLVNEFLVHCKYCFDSSAVGIRVLCSL